MDSLVEAAALLKVRANQNHTCNAVQFASKGSSTSAFWVCQQTAKQCPAAKRKKLNAEHRGSMHWSKSEAAVPGKRGEQAKTFVDQLQALGANACQFGFCVQLKSFKELADRGNENGTNALVSALEPVVLGSSHQIGAHHAAQWRKVMKLELAELASQKASAQRAAATLGIGARLFPKAVLHPFAGRNCISHAALRNVAHTRCMRPCVLSHTLIAVQHNVRCRSIRRGTPFDCG